MSPSNSKNNNNEILVDERLPSVFPRKQERSKWMYLVGINLLILGVDLCSSAGFSYIPPLMLKSGFTPESMNFVMMIGPVLSLFLVPFVGRWSDRLGRRLPFILGLSIILLVSLLAVPYCQELGALFTSGALVVLGLGVVLLDFSSQALVNPCKALVSDCRQAQGFTVFTFMLNLGSSGGYLLTAIKWKSTVLGQRLGGQEKVVFTLLFMVCLLFLVVTLLIVKETPSRHKAKVDNGSRFDFQKTNSQLRHMAHQTFRTFKMTSAYVVGFFAIPENLLRVFVTDFFAWMSFHCHNVYYTDFVGQVIYNGRPEGGVELYDEGVRMGSWGLLLQSIIAVLYAGVAQDWLVARVGPRAAFLFGMASFALSMIGSLVFSDIGTVNLFSAISGFGVAAMSTISCNLAEGYNRERDADGSGRKRGIGEDMAVLDAASFLAQIIPFCFLGTLVRQYQSSTVYLIFSAISGAASCIGILFVVYPKNDPCH